MDLEGYLNLVDPKRLTTKRGERVGGDLGRPSFVGQDVHVAGRILMRHVDGGRQEAA